VADSGERLSGGAHAESVRFVLRLGRALHRYGAPAHRLESALVEVSAALALQGNFFSMPTALFATFEVDDERATYLERLEPSEVELEKLAEVDALAREVRLGGLTPSAASSRLEAIHARPFPHSVTLRIGAGGGVSAAAALLFGGSWREALVAGVGGLAVGALAAVLGPHRNLRRLTESLAGLVMAWVAIGLGRVLEVPSTVATLAGLIVMVPGLAVTRAFTEVAQGSLVSGTSRLFGAILTFLMLGFGVVLGTRSAALVFDGIAPVAGGAGAGHPWWLSLLAAAISAAGFWLLLGAARRDLPWIVVGGIVSFQVARSIAPSLGPELAAFGGALAVGVGSNAYARLLHRPAMIPRVPALLLLVPGSIGYRSIVALASQDALGGVQSAFTVAIVATALAAGLLVSGAIVAPRTEL
jgi:uncharacterized membrane protein YjjP (DUF1212 family)